MIKHENLKEKLNLLLNDSIPSNNNIMTLKTEKPLTKEEFSKMINYDISKHWDDCTSWAENEYKTQDFKFYIETVEGDGKETQIYITLEVKDDLITDIISINEY